jgi:hypothetical protein
VKLSNELLTLWYGTRDAPAPEDDVVSRDRVSLVVGVHPASPMNTVAVDYRIDRGLVGSIPGRELRIDYEANTQYFLACFPQFPTGGVVEYCPSLTCAGRRVPAHLPSEHFPSRFFLANARTPTPTTMPPVVSSARRMEMRQEFLAAVTVQFDAPIFVGDSPEGVRIDVFARSGTVTGPRLNGRVVPGSSDHLFVRTDGVGVLRIRAIMALDDGAMIEVE